MLSPNKLKANPFPIGDGFATQCVVATALQKVPEYTHKKTTAIAVAFWCVLRDSNPGPTD